MTLGQWLGFMGSGSSWFLGNWNAKKEGSLSPRQQPHESIHDKCKKKQKKKKCGAQRETERGLQLMADIWRWEGAQFWLEELWRDFDLLRGWERAKKKKNFFLFLTGVVMKKLRVQRRKRWRQRYERPLYRNFFCLLAFASKKSDRR